MKSLNKDQWIAVGVALIVVVVFLFFIVDVFGIRGDKSTLVDLTQTFDIDQTARVGGTLVTEEGLTITDTVVGGGFPAESGTLITAHYIGRLSDGTVFDSSYDNGKPIEFVLGVGQVIKGWDEGLIGMQAGGKRTLVIPPSLAYGNQGVSGPGGEEVIPPNSTLTFEVELIAVQLISGDEE